MKKRMKWLPLLLMVLILSTMGAMNVYADKTDEGTIYEGVYFNSISLAGKTEEEAEMIISDYVNELLSKPILITMGNRYLEIMPEDIGMTWMNPQIYKEAYNVGRFGNLIKRYKEQKDLESASVELRTVFKADEELLRTLLEEKQSTLSLPAENWSMVKEGKKFTYIEGKSGTLMDMEASYELLVEYFAEEYSLESETPELIWTVAEPLGSEEELAKVKDVLGTFSTWYEGSTPGRNQNVENGARKINGVLLYPGERLSVHDQTAPYTVENGYGIGYMYYEGKSIESVGGGICQVATTLYNAVLLSELHVNNRAPHSMTVGYGQLSADAAIAGDYKDLVFTNNLEYPIYIEGETKGGVITFTIYGVETRSSNRTIEFEPEILEEIVLDIECRETTAPIGTVYCKKDPQIGYKARLWKIIKENGVEVERVQVNNSSYIAVGGIYEIGMSSDNPQAVEAMKAAIAKAKEEKNIQIVYDTAAYWSQQASDTEEGVTGGSEGTGITEDTNTGNTDAGNSDSEEGQ